MMNAMPKKDLKSKRPGLSLKIPPAAQLTIFALMSWVLSAYYPVFSIQHRALDVFAGLLALTGLSVIGLSIAAFIRARTTVNPVMPEAAQELVISGLYRVSRNPMYLGMLLLLLALAAFLGDIVTLVPVILFVVFITEFQIKSEEKALREKFGTQYDAYAKRVRRWI